MTDGEKRENARRLAGALLRHMDSRTVQRLALILDYLPGQLETDIQDLFELVENADEPGAD